jgi:hypothetical protein
MMFTRLRRRYIESKICASPVYNFFFFSYFQERGVKYFCKDKKKKKTACHVLTAAARILNLYAAAKPSVFAIN